MSAAVAITGALIGIAAAALSRFTRGSLDSPLFPRLVSAPVLAVLGLMFGALAGWRLADWPEALAFAVAALVSALLVATDLAAHEIPHKIMWPGMLGLVLALLVDQKIHIDSSIYFIDRLPVHVEPLDVVIVVFASIVVTVLATIPSTRRAASLVPVEAIRAE